ncbi:hypothetical protein [Marmoricola sp. URHB0036]|uniref:hypothetical protein n=1 Tax=Marmoricola sp. URHB0036 TaxID=1298863 RepID=UPI0004136A41|nr:hypothetical protein [Marmoricola sp. URHB0036]
MSDTEGPTEGHQPPPGSGEGPQGSGGEHEPVGSVGEEAAKLLGALSEWARDQGTDYAGSAAGAASTFAHAVRDVNEHIATDSEDCRYCPVCQVIHVVRSTSPEVREHLSVAASSLMHAAAGLLATHTSPSSSPPVQKIDLDDGDDGGSWDEEP